jgi:adenosylcobinamide-phosphate synthase
MSALTLALALVIDGLWGEPPNPVHPVAWMGRALRALKRLAPERGRWAQLGWGTAVAFGLPAAFAGLAWALERALHPYPLLSVLLLAPVLKSMFALRALGEAADGVKRALAGSEDLPQARYALRSLCSRDPSQLDSPLLVAATVESVAENASDSFVAPLFYYALFGLPGAVAYRVVNTLDASIGYRGKYEYLGKAAARLDDLLNLVPARITAALLLLAGVPARSARRGWRVMARDGGRTESPNAGRPMAAMAGLLGVELEKPGHYKLGDAEEALAVKKIDQAWRLVLGAAALASVAALLGVGARDVLAR